MWAIGSKKESYVSCCAVHIIKKIENRYKISWKHIFALEILTHTMIIIKVEIILYHTISINFKMMKNNFYHIKFSHKIII